MGVVPHPPDSHNAKETFGDKEDKESTPGGKILADTHVEQDTARKK